MQVRQYYCTMYSQNLNKQNAILEWAQKLKIHRCLQLRRPQVYFQARTTSKFLAFPNNFHTENFKTKTNYTFRTSITQIYIRITTAPSDV